MVEPENWKNPNVDDFLPRIYTFWLPVTTSETDVAELFPERMLPLSGVAVSVVLVRVSVPLPEVMFVRAEASVIITTAQPEGITLPLPTQ